MSAYGGFAYLYDRLTYDVDYAAWADFLEWIFSRHFAGKPELIADLGCGTGSLCEVLHARGYDMIGIDASPDMLGVAAEKASGKPILYLNQDMTDFELYGTVDVCVSCLDSVNYVTEEADLARMFSLVCNYLNPGGLFVFDVNTPYKYKHILANNVFTYDDDDLFYVWENHFDGALCEFFLNFFVQRPDGAFDRVPEYHVQRCWEIQKLENLLGAAGLLPAAQYGCLTKAAPADTEERIFIIAQKND